MNSNFNGRQQTLTKVCYTYAASAIVKATI